MLPKDPNKYPYVPLELITDYELRSSKLIQWLSGYQFMHEVAEWFIRKWVRKKYKRYIIAKRQNGYHSG